MTATTTKAYKLASGKVIPAGERVQLINIYKKHAVVNYHGSWLRIPRRILAGIPKFIIPEKG